MILSIIRIDSGAFYKCSGSTGIFIPASVTTIGRDAFNGCKLDEIIIDSKAISNFFIDNDSCGILLRYLKGVVYIKQGNVKK